MVYTKNDMNEIVIKESPYPNHEEMYSRIASRVMDMAKDKKIKKITVIVEDDSRLDPG